MFKEKRKSSIGSMACIWWCSKKKRMRSFGLYSYV